MYTVFTYEWLSTMLRIPKRWEQTTRGPRLSPGPGCLAPQPLPHLPPLCLQLGAQGASPAQLILQLLRALSVTSIALLQLPHLPPQLPELP